MPLSGGTLTDILKIKRESNGYNALYLGDKNGGAGEFYTKTDLINPNRFAAFSTYIDGVQKGTLGIYPDGTPVHFNETNNKFKLFHEGNDGSGSGLDADTLDGKHNGELTALNFKTFTHDSEGNYNLNLINDGGIIINYGNNNNKWVDAPDNIIFGAAMCFTGNNNVHNIKGEFAWDINHNSPIDITRNLWWRARGSYNYTPTWGKWHQIAFTDSNVASADKLNYKEFIANDDLDNFTETGCWKSNTDNIVNTIVNKPNAGFTIGGIILNVIKENQTYYIQIIIVREFENNNIKCFIRAHKNNSWYPWKRMLTEDDITSLTTRIAALEAKLK